jgi:hypothetical protein
MFAPSSKDRLTEYDLGRFPGDSLFERVGRAVCRARCLPRKELYEAWEVARRTRRRFRGGRVVDAGGGHGLLAHLMLLLDDTSRHALVVDPGVPPSATRVQEAISNEWPRVAGRVSFVTATIDEFPVESGDVVVSCHACGALTDRVLARAAGAGARVAVLPCCHDVDTCEVGPYGGWVDPGLAIDIGRAARLDGEGYRVWTQTIPSSITPKNRLLLASPRERDARARRPGEAPAAVHSRSGSPGPGRLSQS